jgi:hypothetical protein
VPVGNLPGEIAVGRQALLIIGQGDGTLTRVDKVTGAVRRVQIGTQRGTTAIADDRLWLPNAIAGVVTAIETQIERPPSTVVPVGDSSHVVEARGAPWVLVADQHSGTSAPARIVRLDARSGGVAGRPLNLGRGAHNIVAGADDLWIASRNRRSVLRITPNDDVPAIQPAREGDPTRLRSGPSRAGRRVARVVTFEDTRDGRSLPQTATLVRSLRID